MELTKEMIEEVKMYAWQNEDYVIHMASDGMTFENVPRIRYKGDNYFNPWNEYVLYELGDPYKVFGKKRMEEFCIKVLEYKGVL